MKTQGQSADGWMKKVATHAMKGETSSLSSPRGWWSTFPLQQCRHVPTQGEQAALSRPPDRVVSGSQRRGFQVAVAIPGCWGSEICGGLARLLSEAHDCKTDNGVNMYYIKVYSSYDVGHLNAQILKHWSSRFAYSHHAQWLPGCFGAWCRCTYT